MTSTLAGETVTDLPFTLRDSTCSGYVSGEDDGEKCRQRIQPSGSRRGPRRMGAASGLFLRVNAMPLCTRTHAGGQAPWGAPAVDYCVSFFRGVLFVIHCSKPSIVAEEYGLSPFAPLGFHMTVEGLIRIVPTTPVPSSITSSIKVTERKNSDYALPFRTPSYRVLSFTPQSSRSPFRSTARGRPSSDLKAPP